MSAIDEIAAERARQILQEGWTLEHDDNHSTGDLARLAAAYVLSPWYSERQLEDFLGEPASEWMRKHTTRRDLVIAGALIVAEIERIDRARSA